MAAALKTNRNGVWRDLKGLSAFRSGSWRKLKTLKVYSGGAWRSVGSFVQPLSVSISPSPTTRAAFGDGVHPTTVTSPATTATPSGGLAPYIYAWEKISGDLITAASPTSATTVFRGTVGPGGTASAVYRATVTDASGQTATADVQVGLFYKTI